MFFKHSQIKQTSYTKKYSKIPLIQHLDRCQSNIRYLYYHNDTRQHANFHHPSVNVAKYQKGVYYLGVKVFNMLPSYIKTEFDNPKKFKVVLQKFLQENAFYSLDEYFKLQKVKYLHTIWIDI